MSRERWPVLEAANMAEMLAYFGTSPLAESQLTDEIGWVITGVLSNDYNGVAWTKLDEANADQVIEDVLQRFERRKVYFLWHVQPDSQPADLEERLMAHGCRRLDSGVGMAADLSALNEDARHVSGLTIERVTDERGLAEWMDVWMHNDDGVREPRERLYVSLGLNGDQPLRHYLARLNGQPVGVSQVFLGREAAGVYCVATLQEVRRRGIGTSVVLAPLCEARALGYQVAVLGPTPESQSMYRRIGASASNSSPVHSLATIVIVKYLLIDVVALFIRRIFDNARSNHFCAQSGSSRRA